STPCSCRASPCTWSARTRRCCATAAATSPTGRTRFTSDPAKPGTCSSTRPRTTRYARQARMAWARTTSTTSRTGTGGGSRASALPVPAGGLAEWWPGAACIKAARLLARRTWGRPVSYPAERVRRGRKATMARRTGRLVLVLALAAGSAVLIPGYAAALPDGFAKIGMVCTPGSVSGGTHTFNLVANTGYADTPDGNSVFMWGYANHDAPDNDHFQTPGPVLCVTEGETVVVNLTNTLPEPASIVFPGQEGVTATGGSAGLLTTEAPASGGTVQYSFTADHPGTYLYQSGSDQAKKGEMGVYGALIVPPNTATCPAGAGTHFADRASTPDKADGEDLLLLPQIHPAP